MSFIDAVGGFIANLPMLLTNPQQATPRKQRVGALVLAIVSIAFAMLGVLLVIVGDAFLKIAGAACSFLLVGCAWRFFRQALTKPSA